MDRQNLQQLLRIPKKLSYNLETLSESDTLALIGCEASKTEPKLNHVKGVVVNKKEGIIVATSFPHTNEVKSTEFKSVIDGMKGKDMIISKAIEGTIVRLFFGDDRWYISTHNRLDGRESRWSGITFGELFDRLWGEEDYDKFMDRDKCYIFLISCPENRMVCKTKDTLLLVSVLKREEGSMIYSDLRLKETHPSVSIQEQELCNRSSVVEKVLKYVDNIGWENYTGILVRTAHSDFRDVRCVKVVNELHRERKEARGCDPDVRARYLYLTSRGMTKEIRLLEEMFPEYESSFLKIKNGYKRLLEYLSSCYQTRYRKHQRQMFPQAHHVVIEHTFNNYESRSLEKNIEAAISSVNRKFLRELVDWFE